MRKPPRTACCFQHSWSSQCSTICRGSACRLGNADNVEYQVCSVGVACGKYLTNHKFGHGSDGSKRQLVENRAWILYFFPCRRNVPLILQVRTITALGTCATAVSVKVSPSADSTSLPKVRS